MKKLSTYGNTMLLLPAAVASSKQKQKFMQVI